MNPPKTGDYILVSTRPDGDPYVYDFSKRAASAKQEPTEVTMREVTHV